MPFPFKLFVLQCFDTIDLFEIFSFYYVFVLDAAVPWVITIVDPTYFPFPFLSSCSLFLSFYFSSGVFRRFGPKAVTYTPLLFKLPHTQLVITSFYLRLLHVVFILKPLFTSRMFAASPTAPPHHLSCPFASLLFMSVTCSFGSFSLAIFSHYSIAFCFFCCISSVSFLGGGTSQGKIHPVRPFVPLSIPYSPSEYFPLFHNRRDWCDVVC